MKRKLLSVILVLTMLLCLSACGCEHQWIDADCDHPMMCSLCAETQGEPLGHSWVEVSCTEPKHCAHCDATEGEPLGHTWQEATCTDAQKCTACGQIQGEALGHTWEEATTEAPQTCTVCQATEGAKLDTDARFTTAATKQLQGKWAGDFMLPGDLIGTTGYLDQLECTVYYEFGNAGAYSLYIQLKDEDAFEEAMLQMIIDASYAALAESSISQEEADEAMVATYGMTIDEYAAAVVAELDIQDMFSDMNGEGVYYVEGNTLYLADSWGDGFEASTFTLENDVLMIEDNYLEDADDVVPLVRVP